MTDKLPESEALSANDALLEEFSQLFPEGRVGRREADINWKDLIPASPTALCLSGGGIRSATFSLGVMQGLAAASQFGRFHYLSTVSGGGYIGSWLSRYAAGELVDGVTAPGTPGDPLDALSETPDSKRPPEHPLRRLRSFSNYLSPSLGLSLDSLTVATIFLRNLLLNLLFWVPLLLLLAMLPWLAAAAVPQSLTNALPSRLVTMLGDAGVAALIVPLIALTVWLGFAAIVLLGGWKFTEAGRERLSRLAAAPLLIGIPWLLVFAAFVFVPHFVMPVFSQKLGLSGTGATGGLIAILTSLVGYWSRYGPDLRKKAYGIANALNARLLDVLAAVALLALALGATITVHAWILWWIEPSRAINIYTIGDLDRDDIVSEAFIWTMVGLAAVAIVSAALVGVNRFSLHALYGNRLVRAYLGSARKVREPKRFTDFDPRDNFAMAGLPGGPAHPGPRRSPFHLVNMTLNITKSSRSELDWQERKGASFSATPLHSGSSVTGYVPSNEFGGDWGMTLGRAMTISGAAASPNMGYHSSPLMALLMTFFNIRLGWWVPNPAWIARSRPSERSEPESRLRSLLAGLRSGPGERSEPRFGLRYVLREAFSGTTFHSDWLYLSDGGHFDNLGLYEMVRRRCLTIVVIDGGCDGEFKHSDLHNAVRKISVDLSVPIDLPAHLPGQAGADSGDRVTIGTIRYEALGDGYPNGKLFVLKPVLVGDEPPALRAYAEVSRRGGKTFPHHSTGDQFFNETQFESYRRLGEWSVQALLAAMGSARAATAPAGPAADAPKPPPAALTGMEGAVAAVSNLGPGQMILGLIAAAGAVGATVGIVESVTTKVIEKIPYVFASPKPPPPDTSPVQTGTEEPVNEPAVNPVIEPEVPDTEPVASLATVIERLDTIIDRLPAATSERDRVLLREITVLRARLERHMRTVPGQSAAAPPVDLGPVIRELRAMQANQPGRMDANLSEVVRQLRIIAARNNARGQ